jgi:hypothetical protein
LNGVVGTLVGFARSGKRLREVHQDLEETRAGIEAEVGELSHDQQTASKDVQLASASPSSNSARNF